MKIYIDRETATWGDARDLVIVEADDALLASLECMDSDSAIIEVAESALSNGNGRTA